MKLQRYIRLDFTPLVDIAMILVLAYMVILYHQKAKVIELGLPRFSCTEPVPMCNLENTTTTLFLFENHLYYSDGYDELNPINKADYSLDSFKEIVNFKKRKGIKMIIIKPQDSSTYGDLVAIISHCQSFKTPYALVPHLLLNEEIMLAQAEQTFTKSLIVSQ